MHASAYAEHKLTDSPCSWCVFMYILNVHASTPRAGDRLYQFVFLYACVRAVPCMLVCVCVCVRVCRLCTVSLLGESACDIHNKICRLFMSSYLQCICILTTCTPYYIQYMYWCVCVCVISMIYKSNTHTHICLHTNTRTHARARARTHTILCIIVNIIQAACTVTHMHIHTIV